MNVLQALPPDVVSLADHARRAQAALDPATWAYFAGGAADEHTLRANEAAWARVPLLPRVLRPLDGLSTQVTLLGRTMAHPMLVAPIAYQRLACPDGELATALAASALEAGFVLSTQSTVPLEHIARAIGKDASRGPMWFQLYWQRDAGLVRDLLARAEAAGFEAIVLTVDAPVAGTRDRERAAGFRLPPGMRAVHLPESNQPGDAATLAAGAPTWSDVEWLRGTTRLPIVLKGITHPADAQAALVAGAAAVIVSNHGGRTLDTVPATAELLPGVVAAVQGRIPVLVDGGIRRGTDVLKALAMGASGVLVGRPVLWGLASAGPIGAAHVLRLLRDELEAAMALSGCRSLADAGPALVNLA